MWIDHRCGTDHRWITSYELIELWGVRVVHIVFSMVFDFITCFIKNEIKHELHLPPTTSVWRHIVRQFCAFRTCVVTRLLYHILSCDLINSTSSLFASLWNKSFGISLHPFIYFVVDPLAYSGHSLHRLVVSVCECEFFSNFLSRDPCACAVPLLLILV